MAGCKVLAAVLLLPLVGCQAAGPEVAPTFSGIEADERVHFTGTEPFWSGEVKDGEVLYRTPENIEGQRFAVSRFAGNNGVSFTGALAGKAFDMMVTPGRCSDGMSDRSYPYTVTVEHGGQRLNGCGWTDRKPFTGPDAS